MRTGDSLRCTLEPLVDEDGFFTQLEPSHIAFVFEGGGLSATTATEITGCDVYNNDSLFYDPNVYNSSSNKGGYDVKWCFDSTAKTSTNGVNTLTFDIIAPFSLPSPAWFRLSAWLYFNSQWNIITNDVGNEWYNYSIVTGYEAAVEVLDVDESVPITLLFGTESVSEFTTDCDGEVTSGTLTLDSAFNIYDFAAQQRLLDLCVALNEITDTVMYRRDDDQEMCFGSMFNAYLNSSGRSQQIPLSNQTIFNQFISDFVETRSFNGIDPRRYNSWFGTKTNVAWQNENSSIVWFKHIVQTQINKNWGGSAMYEYYQKWEDFMTDFNANSPATFQGVQLSYDYIRMEVEVAFLDGFVQSVMYTIVLCAIVMIFFTQNLYLVLLVCLYILIICIWVVGLFGALGWPFGIIEIISVPTVVGLTIDYALHITHAYIHSPFPDRARRAKSAVNDLGSSVLASAMTTISAMIILYFATIVIFSDLGWVVGSTTAFGVALALFVCPPCLMYTGPQYDQCHFSWFCPHSMNGIKCGHHRFCSNEWHGKNGIAKEQKKSIELQVHKEDKQEEEGTNGGGIDGDANATQPGSGPDNDDDNEFDDDLPLGWKAVLTADGKVYYQNDDTHKTQWKRPVSNGIDDIGAIRAPVISTSIQSEPGDELDDLPPSRQQSANVKYENQIEADSDAEDSNQPYVVPMFDKKTSGAPINEAVDSPLVNASNADEQKQDIEDDASYIPPNAPDAPSSPEEINLNKVLMKTAFTTQGDADLDNMELEQSISLNEDD